MATILIIDDDNDLFALLQDYLADEGFTCVHADNPELGLQKLAHTTYDALVLDVMLPSINGFEVLRRIRSNDTYALLPIIMLTARGEEIDKVVGLEMGADDYLGKPFSPRELAARLKALIRRSKLTHDTHPPHTITQIDDLIINPSSLTTHIQGVQKDITMSELRLLSNLIQNKGQVVSRDSLSNAIFGHDAYPMDRSLDMLVSRLRKKLGPQIDGTERIKAIRGEGYLYREAGKPSE